MRCGTHSHKKLEVQATRRGEVSRAVRGLKGCSLSLGGTFQAGRHPVLGRAHKFQAGPEPQIVTGMDAAHVELDARLLHYMTRSYGFSCQPTCPILN